MSSANQAPPPNPNTGLVPRVPQEIQRAILEIALEDFPPRLIEIRQDFVWSQTHQQNIARLSSPCGIPNILGISHESYQMVLGQYEWSFGVEGIQGREWRNRILINWAKDMVYFGNDVDYQLVQDGIVLSRDPLTRYRVHGVDRVRKMALLDLWWGAPTLTNMPVWAALREVTLVTADRDLSSAPRLVVNTVVNMAFFRQSRGWNINIGSNGSLLVVRLGRVNRG
ncbi:hypothetical protein IFR05_015322 [Cadophora sp. M221]|nr:hypothetical protein IFR05_015322 [Cadophora sp. M221]